MNEQGVSKIHEMIEETLQAKNVEDLKMPGSRTELEDFYEALTLEVDRACFAALEEFKSSIIGDNDDEEAQGFCKLAVVLNKLCTAISGTAIAKLEQQAEAEFNFGALMMLQAISSMEGVQLTTKIASMGFMYGIHFAKTEMK